MPLVNRDQALDGFFSAWAPGRAVVIYCGGQSCGLSRDTAFYLLQYVPSLKVYVLKGGFPAWHAYQQGLTL